MTEEKYILRAEPRNRKERPRYIKSVSYGDYVETEDIEKAFRWHANNKPPIKRIHGGTSIVVFRGGKGRVFRPVRVRVTTTVEIKKPI